MATQGEYQDSILGVLNKLQLTERFAGQANSVTEERARQLSHIAVAVGWVAGLFVSYVNDYHEELVPKFGDTSTSAIELQELFYQIFGTAQGNEYLDDASKSVDEIKVKAVGMLSNVHLAGESHGAITTAIEDLEDMIALQLDLITQISPEAASVQSLASTAEGSLLRYDRKV